MKKNTSKDDVKHWVKKHVRFEIVSLFNKSTKKTKQYQKTMENILHQKIIDKFNKA